MERKKVYEAVIKNEHMKEIMFRRIYDDKDKAIIGVFEQMVEIFYANEDITAEEIGKWLIQLKDYYWTDYDDNIIASVEGREVY